MCGVFGWLVPEGHASSAEKISETRRIAETFIGSRGPDSFNEFTSESFVCWHSLLGTRAGSRAETVQPVISECRRYVIAFNGQIYNTAELCAGYGIRYSASDTECLKHLVSKAKTLSELVSAFEGMFAIVIYDNLNQCLLLARDCFGVKPLFVARDSSGFYFSSDARGLAHVVSHTLNENSIAAYRQFGFVPAGMCIFQEVEDVPPGTILEIDRNGVTSQSRIALKQSGRTFCETDFWETFKLGVLACSSGEKQPGLFLSGGIDSTLIALAMRELDLKPYIYTAGFESSKLDESIFAVQTAKTLGFDVVTEPCRVDQLAEEALTIQRKYDQPFADSSALALSRLVAAASNNTNFALSGDGGDELFGGYYRYILADRLVFALSVLNKTKLKIIANSFANLLPDRFFENLLRFIGFNNSSAARIQMIRSLITIPHTALSEIYSRILSIDGIIYTEIDPSSYFTSQKFFSERYLDNIHQMMDFDINCYLPSDILYKSDRVGMSAGFELRVPFLLTRILSHANNIPIDQLLDRREGKKFLRKIVEKKLPGANSSRPKTGFTNPLEQVIALLRSQGALDDSFKNPTQSVHRIWTEWSLKKWREQNYF